MGFWACWLSSVLITGFAPVQDAPEELPTVTVTTDDTVIDRSCLVVVPDGAVIPDENGDGVIHVTGDGIRLQFLRGSRLRGAPDGTPGDELTGIGLRIAGRKDVTILGFEASGYKVGLEVTDSQQVLVNRCEFDGLFRQRLASTARVCRDGEDWLAPHHNDEGQWIEKYGAAVSVRNSTEVSLRRVRVRRTQNGIVLDRVRDSEVFDSDCSFLSGWGVALWRSSKNTITRNQFDFCIRGYSHGVYNRGQDSAGILVFEQCSENVIAENSATHGGDGLFGFAGLEALGQKPAPTEDFSYERRGNNDNLIIGNDFSFAAAHGLEMTFSFGNQIMKNRLAENAICGFWGGYSQDTAVIGNIFVRNGDQGYGLERGGVNIEHSVRNRIHDNRFIGDECGVHLWWDEDPGLLETPWAKANSTACIDNQVTFNLFERTPVALHVRQAKNTRFGDNKLVEVGKEIEADDPDEVEIHSGGNVSWDLPAFFSKGKTRPIQLRREWQGRQNIILGEWGPWDFESTLVRPVSRQGRIHEYEFYGPFEAPPTLEGPGLGLSMKKSEGRFNLLAVTVTAQEAGVFPYTLAFPATADGVSSYDGVIVNTKWSVAFFPCDFDPREDADAWDAAKGGESAVRVEAPAIDFVFGAAGPQSLELGEELREKGPGADHFGTHATADIPLPAGTWILRTMSDDGVRVRVDGEVLIERWTHHAPTEDRGQFTLEEAKTVSIEVEHFELDGHAVLQVELLPE